MICKPAFKFFRRIGKNINFVYPVCSDRSYMVNMPVNIFIFPDVPVKPVLQIFLSAAYVIIITGREDAVFKFFNINFKRNFRINPENVNPAFYGFTFAPSAIQVFIPSIWFRVNGAYPAGGIGLAPVCPSIAQTSLLDSG